MNWQQQQQQQHQQQQQQGNPPVPQFPPMAGYPYGQFNPYYGQAPPPMGYAPPPQQMMMPPPQMTMMQPYQQQQVRPPAPSVVVAQSEGGGTLAKVPMNVFVGKLPLDVDDSFVAHLLQQCGPVLKWKRTMDAETNRPKAFGFCTFASAHGAMQAVRLLNDLDVLNGHKILVKVGKKEQAIIESLARGRMDLSPAETELLEQLRGICRTLDARKPVAATAVQALPTPAATGDVADPAILEEMAKFRSKQALRDRELEDERRRKLQAKIQETLEKKEAPPAPAPAPVVAKKRKATTPTALEAHDQPTDLAPSAAKLGFGLAKQQSKKPHLLATPKPSLFNPEKPTPRPLKKLDDDDDDAGRVDTKVALSTSSTTQSAADDADRAVAETIPTDKAALFALPVDWSAVDAKGVIRGKLRPWVAKKMAEYLGGDEPTLTDFVATQLEKRATPDYIASELALVLEDDAHTFVHQLWRVLHFHAKRPAD